MLSVVVTDDMQQVNCPVCHVGPVKEADVLTIQRMARKGSPKKAAAAASTGGEKVETITLLDSSDEEEEETPKPTMISKFFANNSKAKLKTVKDVEGDYAMDEDVKPAAFLAKGAFRSSSKLDALVAYLNGIREADPHFKAVIFRCVCRVSLCELSCTDADRYSNFTGFLDLMEVSLTQARHSHLRLDGTLSQKSRANIVNKFTKSTKSECLLASIRAGGVGLNLICANHVVIMDSWWNSATEDQAVDRIHRFGQTKDVFVKRFLVDNSIEGKIIRIQERKKRIVSGALGKEEEGGKKSVTDDLRDIFED